MTVDGCEQAQPSHEMVPAGAGLVHQISIALLNRLYVAESGAEKTAAAAAVAE